MVVFWLLSAVCVVTSSAFWFWISACATVACMLHYSFHKCDINYLEEKQKVCVCVCVLSLKLLQQPLNLCAPTTRTSASFLKLNVRDAVGGTHCARQVHTRRKAH